ncbi:hypothetical protein INS49_012703 [Diaporthe citri]|uniref:uncharacterized protein n=1 Tax=Diaporthe citri TaxID=83186 RepID=UPI001C80514A|nr:uncharacterized protein INS49_012703 [Diaporthe citri]KAG6359183.1 hypothetical protein INS49_012703 [Diaporthe citri]
MPGHGSSSKGKHRGHGSSHHGSSHHGSSSKGKQPAAQPKDRNWIGEGNFNLTKFKENELSKLIVDSDDKDFRLSRAWLCFAQENIVDDVATNHAFLKFDFRPCNNHSWRGAKLEAVPDPSEDEMLDETTGILYTSSNVNLNLKEYAGPPRSLRFCMELDARFNDSTGSTTLGNLIYLLSRAGLIRFGFSTKMTIGGLDMYVGCRDYVAQVLFSLQLESRITKRLRDPEGYSRELMVLDESGKEYTPKVGAVFPDVHAVLASFFEEVDRHLGGSVVVASTSKVETGYFPDHPKRSRTGDGYPYQVKYPFGYKYGDVAVTKTSEKTRQEGGAAQASQGAYGGQARQTAYGSQPGQAAYGPPGEAAYGGQGGQAAYGAYASQPGQAAYGQVGQGAYGGRGGPSGASMPGPSGYYQKY